MNTPIQIVTAESHSPRKKRERISLIETQPEADWLVPSRRKYYEVVIETAEGESEPIGTPRLNRAKAEEEYRELRHRFPTAEMISVWYTTRADGSLWRRPLVRILPHSTDEEVQRRLRLHGTRSGK